MTSASSMVRSALCVAVVEIVTVSSRYAASDGAVVESSEPESKFAGAVTPVVEVSDENGTVPEVNDPEATVRSVL